MDAENWGVAATPREDHRHISVLANVSRLVYAIEGWRERYVEEVGGILDETGAGAGKGHAPLPDPSPGNEPDCGFVEEAEEVGEVGREWGRGAGEMDRCGHCGAGDGGTEAAPLGIRLRVPYGYTRVGGVIDSTNIFIFVANKDVIGKCQSILTIQFLEQLVLYKEGELEWNTETARELFL